MSERERKRIDDRFKKINPDKERLFRANAGSAWVSNKISKLKDGSLLLKNPRRFNGMPEGFPDTIGWETIEVTQDMVGKKIAVFVAEEHKRAKNDKLRERQGIFKRLLESMGGIYRVIR